MSHISRILRGQVLGGPINGEWYSDGLGAFMGSHISKSLLAAGAIVSGLLAVGAVYTAMIFGSDVTDISLSAWDWAIVGWSFVSAYTIAYHLLMAIDASVCSVYLMIHESSAEVVKDNLRPLRHLLESTIRPNTTRLEWDLAAVSHRQVKTILTNVSEVIRGQLSRLHVRPHTAHCRVSSAQVCIRL